MIWVQNLICFAVWIGYGVFQSRRSQQIRETVMRMPRGNRVRNGVLCMLTGAFLLFGAFIGCNLGQGFTPTGMKPWAWFAIGLGGLAFVHMQTMSMAMLVSLVQDGVTSEPTGPSDPQRSDPTV